MRGEKALDIANKIGDDLYMQSRVIRWNGRITILNENIAEHHAYVSQLVIALLDEYDVPVKYHLPALKRAVTHDMAEVATSDIPYVIKRDYPDFAKAYDKVEDDIISKMYPSFKNCEIEKHSVPWLVVKLADSIDVYLFCKREVELGSKNKDIVSIYHSSVRRFEDFERALVEKINAEKSFVLEGM